MLTMIHCVIASILFVLQESIICTAQGDSSSKQPPPPNTIPNPALGKWATQSGMYAGRDAGRAVDGYLYSGSDSRHCSSIDTSDPSYRGNRDFAWWQVDLADTYTVTSVTIFNTDDSQEWQYQYNFTVYLSYQSDVSDAASRTVCQWVKPTSIVFDGAPDVVRVQRNDSFNVNCTRPLVGQYVTIQRTGGVSPGRMALCEVEVEATRYYVCQNCLGNCSHSTGCASCNRGFIPPTCTRGCERGTYGINCANRCPQCPGTDLPCDKVTGQCPCLDGSDCKTSTVTYGSNTTTLGVGYTETPGGLLQSNSTTRGPTSGVERFRDSRATVLGSLVLIVVLQMTKRRHC